MLLGLASSNFIISLISLDALRSDRVMNLISKSVAGTSKEEESRRAQNLLLDYGPFFSLENAKFKKDLA